MKRKKYHNWSEMRGVNPNLILIEFSSLPRPMWIASDSNCDFPTFSGVNIRRIFWPDP